MIWEMGNKHNGMEWVSLMIPMAIQMVIIIILHNYSVLASNHVEHSLDSVSVELEIVSMSSLDSPPSSISRQQTRRQSCLPVPGFIRNLSS